MDNELVGRVLHQFVDSRSSVKHAILNQRAYLQQMADRGKLTEAYAEVMNGLLGSMAMHLEAMDELLGLIGLNPEQSPAVFAQDFSSIAAMDVRRQRQIWELIDQYQRLKANHEYLVESYRFVVESDIQMGEIFYKQLIKTSKTTKQDLIKGMQALDEEERIIFNFIYPPSNSHEVRTSNRKQEEPRRPATEQIC